MDRDERVEDVADDIDRLAVAEVALASGVRVEQFTVDVLGDEEPVASRGLASPVDLGAVRLSGGSAIAPWCS